MTLIKTKHVKVQLDEDLFNKLEEIRVTIGVKHVTEAVRYCIKQTHAVIEHQGERATIEQEVMS